MSSIDFNTHQSLQMRMNGYQPPTIGQGTPGSPDVSFTPIKPTPSTIAITAELGVSEPQQTFNINYVDKVVKTNETGKLYKTASVKSQYLNPFIFNKLNEGKIQLFPNQSIFTVSKDIGYLPNIVV